MFASKVALRDHGGLKVSHCRPLLFPVLAALLATGAAFAGEVFFALRINLDASWDAAYSLAPADFDPDGDLDVFAEAGEGSGEFARWANELDSGSAFGTDWCKTQIDTGVSTRRRRRGPQRRPCASPPSVCSFVCSMVQAPLADSAYRVLTIARKRYISVVSLIFCCSRAAYLEARLVEMRRKPHRVTHHDRHFSLSLINPGSSKLSWRRLRKDRPLPPASDRPEKPNSRRTSAIRCRADPRRSGWHLLPSQ